MDFLTDEAWQKDHDCSHQNVSAMLEKVKQQTKTNLRCADAILLKKLSDQVHGPPFFWSPLVPDDMSFPSLKTNLQVQKNTERCNR
jgi:hypothetical protein